jgi:hypothetical protein
MIACSLVPVLSSIICQCSACSIYASTYLRIRAPHPRCRHADADALLGISASVLRMPDAGMQAAPVLRIPAPHPSAPHPHPHPSGRLRTRREPAPVEDDTEREGGRRKKRKKRKKPSLAKTHHWGQTTRVVSLSLSLLIPPLFSTFPPSLPPFCSAPRPPSPSAAPPSAAAGASVAAAFGEHLFSQLFEKARVRGVHFRAQVHADLVARGEGSPVASEQPLTVL